MSAALKDLFDDIGFPKNISAGQVLKIAHNKAKNEINLNVSFSELIPMKELFSASENISKKLGAETAIYPKYFPELLNSDYLYEIIELLKKKFVGI